MSGPKGTPPGDIPPAPPRSTFGAPRDDIYTEVEVHVRVYRLAPDPDAGDGVPVRAKRLVIDYEAKAKGSAADTSRQLAAALGALELPND